MKPYAFILILSFLIGRSHAQFTVYNSINSGITNNDCWYVTQSPSNEIWVSTWGSGVFKFNGNTWTNYNKNNSGIKSQYMTTIVFESASNVWLGSYSDGLNNLNGNTWASFTSKNSGFTDTDIVPIVIDGQNNKWIGGRNTGLWKFDGKNWTTFNTTNSAIPSDVIYALEVDAAGNIWVGTAFGGLSKFNPVNNTWTNYTYGNSMIPHNDIYSLKFNSKTNKLWIGTFAGIAVFDLSNNMWTVYTKYNSGLPDNYVRGFAFHNAKNETWIATGAGGIAKFNGTSWQVFNTGNSNLPINKVWSVFVNQPSIKNPNIYDIWASTMGGGVVKLSVGADGNFVTGLTETKKTNLPFTCFPNPAKNHFFIDLDHKEKNRVFTLYNSLGQQLMEKSIEDSETLFEVSVENLAAGLYSCFITSDEGIRQSKILITE